MRQTWITLPRRVRWPLVSMVVALVGLGTLYSGYCSGLWGRNTLLLHYLFQCNCPAASEAVRYSDFTVLVPACRWPEVEAMSADGRYLIVTEHAAPRASYRLDLQTNQRQLVWTYDPAWGNSTDVPRFWFLTDNLLLTRGKGTRFALVDVQTQKRVPVRWQYADQSTPHSITLLRSATQIIIAESAGVVLAPDPLDHPDQNLVLYSAVLSQSKVQERVSALGITVPVIRLARPFGSGIGMNGLTARRAPLWADRHGIHPPDTPIGGAGMVLLRPTNLGYNTRNNAYSYFPVGWTTDDAAVVYNANPRYVIEDWAPIYASVDYFPVPQPVLLLPAPPVPPGGE